MPGFLANPHQAALGITENNSDRQRFQRSHQFVYFRELQGYGLVPERFSKLRTVSITSRMAKGFTM